MLIAQFNPIRFYADQRAVQEFDPDKNPSDIVFYPVGVVPPFQLIVSAATSASFSLVSLDGTEIQPGANLTIEDQTSYKRIIFTGDELDNQQENYLCIKVTNGSENYYSDYFCWKNSTELPQYLKLKVVSADLTMGKNKKYRLNMAGTTHEFYLPAEYITQEPQIDQKGDEQQGLTIPNSGTRTVTHHYEVDSNQQIYAFLSAIGLILANGEVTLTWNYETFTVSQCEISVLDDRTKGHYQLKLSITDANQSVSLSNEIIE